MRSVNYSELRQNLKVNLDAVNGNAELLVVHRPKGKSIVLISLDEYNATIQKWGSKIRFSITNKYICLNKH